MSEPEKPETFRHIGLEREGDVARITFRRPPLNILDIGMIREINQALAGLLDDRDLKLLVLAGEGKAFSAGVEVADHAPDKADGMIEAFNELFVLLRKFECPTLAAVRGAALGGGCEVILFCDMVIASEKAKFGQPEIKLGFFAPLAEIALARLVGRNRAVELLCTGRIIGAVEAERIGLVNRCVPEEAFDEAVSGLIEEIAAMSPLILRYSKGLVDRVRDLPFDDALKEVTRVFLGDLIRSEDCQEGLQAFVEKRPPEWKNR